MAVYLSNAGLWLRHSRQMPRAYDVEGAYERWLQNVEQTLANQSLMAYAL